MAKERLDIIIAAEVDGAAASIKELAKIVGVELKQGEAVLEQFEQAIKDLEKTAKASQTPEELAQLTSRLIEAKKALSNFKAGKDVFASANKGIKDIAANAPQASNAVLNLGRIAQDSAFGFIGIANNIEPFIQSIKSLKDNTAKGQSAVKSFFSALAGPAGIGVLIGAISLFDAYSNGYGVFAGKAKKATDAQKEFNDELDDARAGALSTGIQLQALIAITQDASKTDTVRANALKQVNDITGQYGIKITNATIATGEAANAVNELTKSLIAQAVAAKLSDKLADLIIKQSDATKSFADAQTKLNKAKLEEASINRIGAKVQIGGGGVSGASSAANVTETDRLAKAQDAAAKSADEYKTVTKELQSVSALLNAETAKGLALVKTKTGVDKSGKAAIDSETESVKELTAAEKENAAFLAANLQKRPLDIQLLKATTEETNRITAALKAQNEQKRIDQALSQFGAGLANPQATLANAQATVNGVLANAAALQQEQQVMATLATQTANAEQTFNLLAPAIDATFGALASGENVGEALAASLKQVVVQLIAAVAKALILQAILSAFTGGAASGGGFLKILTGALGFRAAGGPLFGGQPTIVGENGPELITSAGYGNISPAGQMGGTLSAVVSGNDLLFILNQANSNRRGNFG